jgi:hypothetical protein
MLGTGLSSLIILSSKLQPNTVLYGFAPIVAPDLCGRCVSLFDDPRVFFAASREAGTLVCHTPAESLALMRAVLDDVAGPARDVVLLNAGAALYVAGVARDLAEGGARAREALASGRARDKLAELVAMTQALAAETTP